MLVEGGASDLPQDLGESDCDNGRWGVAVPPFPAKGAWLGDAICCELAKGMQDCGGAFFLVKTQEEGRGEGGGGGAGA